jgi:hypothetical protein
MFVKDSSFDGIITFDDFILKVLLTHFISKVRWTNPIYLLNPTGDYIFCTLIFTEK